MANADGTYRTPDFGTLHRLDDEPVSRIFVSEDRTVLVNLWANGEATVATRSNSWETWGPPITLTEEKT